MSTPVTDHSLLANAVRVLAMDAVNAAKSGHPGMPMGMADVATVLFRQFMKFDPGRPDWPDRDRFVLSAGHGSMLLYAILHLTGFEDFPLEQLKNFRQLGYRTAGHPEYGHGAGIETTTGPLGQGLATAVGMALAERMQNARFGDGLVDHYTYVIASDGDMMEGISHEAISLAGHLRLGRLIVLFDDNQISIDGPTRLAFTGSTLARFEAAGWDTDEVNGHDPAAVARAIERAKDSPLPSLIACRTVIGYGAPNKKGTAGVHGAPLGAEETLAAREELGWHHPPFEIPEEVRAAWKSIGDRGGAERRAWEERLAAAPDETRRRFQTAIAGKIPATLSEAIRELKKRLSQERPTIATRVASQKALEVINPLLETTVGGSADLTGSNNTKTSDLSVVTSDDYSGRYIHYGVREHGMAAAMNGLALHGGFIPYGGTFLVFSDYSRPSIRIAALSGIRAIHVLTHDSIGLGEDGPTHQPIEHLAALRAMPNLNVFRPADAVETAECWELALKADRMPSVLALTRQGVPTLRLEHSHENLSAKGAYILREAGNGVARVTLLATGSEVEIAVAARDLLEAEGIGTRVVSMPSWELFATQDEAYRRATIDPATVRVAVEAAAGLGWERWVGDSGGFVGMTGFGASAPYQDLYEHFGITAERVASAARARL